MLNEGSDSACLGRRLRRHLSNRLPVMLMLLVREHSVSDRAGPMFQLWSFYSESLGVANGF